MAEDKKPKLTRPKGPLDSSGESFGDSFALPKFDGDEDGYSFEQSKDNLAAPSGEKSKINKGSYSQKIAFDGTGAKINQPSAGFDPGDSSPLALTPPGGSRAATSSELKPAAPQYLQVRRDLPPGGTAPKGQEIWPENSRFESGRSKNQTPLKSKDNRQKRADGDKYSGVEFRLAQSDPYIKRFRIIRLSLAGLILIAGAYYLVKNPEIVGILQSEADSWTATKSKRIKKSAEVIESKMTVNSTDANEMDQALEGGLCSSISHVGLKFSQDLALTGKARLRVADCLLSASRYSEAERMLKPLRMKLVASSERAINLDSTDTALGAAFVFATMASLKQGRIQEVTKSLHGRCTTWSLVPTCVARLIWEIKHGDINIAAVGHETLSIKTATVDALTKAYLGYVGAMVASAKGVPVVADERYWAALKVAPKTAHALIREIYDSWALALYRRRDVATLSRVMIRAQQEAIDVDMGANWKLQLIRDLVDPKKGPGALAQFLSRPEISFRARQDFEFSTAIGVDALKWNLGAKYIDLMTEVRSAMQSGLFADSSAISTVNIWRLRGYVAQGRYSELFKEVNDHERTFGSSAVSRHFRGIAYMSSNQDAKAQLLAAREFRAAYDLNRSWQSSYSLAVALIRSGEPSHGQNQLRKMEKEPMNPAALRWFSVALAELFLANNNPQEVIKAVEALNKIDPESAVIWDLKAAAFRLLHRRDDAQAASRMAEKIRKSPGYSMGQEVLTSPLGPFVFAL